MILDRIAPNRKPAFGSVQINQAHRLAPDNACFLFNEGGGTCKSLVGTSIGTLTDPSATWKVGSRGISLDQSLTVSATRGVTVSPGVALLVNTPWSLRIRFFFRGADAFGCLFTQAAAAGAYIASGKVRFYSAGASATALVANTWYDWITTHDSSNSLIYYLNGQIDTTGVAFAATLGLDAIGNDTASETFDGQFETIQVWNRLLLASEILQLYFDPYVFLTPKAPRVWMLSQAPTTPAPPPVVVVPPTGFGGGAGGGPGNFQSWGPTCDPALVPPELRYSREAPPNCPQCGRLMQNRQLRARRRAWRCPEIYWDPYTGQWEHKYVGGVWLPPVTRPTIPGAPPPEQETRPHRPRRVK
jgi:hypothetical protein